MPNEIKRVVQIAVERPGEPSEISRGRKHNHLETVSSFLFWKHEKNPLCELFSPFLTSRYWGSLYFSRGLLQWRRTFHLQCLKHSAALHPVHFLRARSSYDFLGPSCSAEFFSGPVSSRPSTHHSECAPEFLELWWVLPCAVLPLWDGSAPGSPAEIVAIFQSLAQTPHSYVKSSAILLNQSWLHPALTPHPLTTSPFVVVV